MPARGELCIDYKINRKGEVRPEPLRHRLKTITVNKNDAEKCDHLMFYDMDGGSLLIVFEENRLFIMGIGFTSEEAYRDSLMIGRNKPADEV